MEGTLYSRFEVVESLPSSPGEFAEEAFKARESAPDGHGSRSRIVMMRSLPKAADTETVSNAISRATRLTPHPSILATYGVIEAPGEPGEGNTLFVISEYIRGILLSERIRRIAPFSLKTTLDIAIVVSEALAFADAAGLDTHDVRPQDIICTAEGDIKVADIEVGQSIRSAARPVLTYISGSAAVGGMIFQMLTGRSPLESDEQPILPSTAGPESLHSMLQRALAGTFPSITELSAELKSIRSEISGSRVPNRRSTDVHPLPASPFLDLPNGSSSRTEPARFGPAVMSNTAREIVPEERGKENAVPSGSAPKREPQVQRVKPQAQEIYDDEYSDRASGMSWPRRIGMVLAGAVAAAVIGFCIYVVMLVSNVPDDVPVPNLIGQQFADASQKEIQSHLHLIQTGHNYSDTWPQGAIYQQDPLPGRIIKAGKEVDVMVSDGPRLMPVPDLSQMTLKRAQGTLQDSGLPIGPITYNYDDTTPKGIVTSQNPQPAANVSRLTSVSLVVSKGPAPPAPPTNLSATCTVAGEIDLSWSDSQSAETYDVYRDGQKIASQIPETTYSDVALQDSLVHSYTITAANSNGESAQSAAATASDNPDATQGSPNASSTPASNPPPVMPQPSVSAAPGAPKERQFRVQFRVPNTGTTHKVQIDIQDTTGTSEVYDEEMYGGDTVNKTFQAFGNRVILRIFIDGKLVRQQPK